MTPHDEIIPPNTSRATEKLCPWCKEVKEISAFSRDCSMADGLQYICKKCQSKYREGRPRIKHTPPDLEAYFVCATCGVSKMAKDFRLNYTKPSGISPHCLECARNKEKNRYAQTKEAYKERSKSFRSRNVDQIQEQILNHPSQKPAFKQTRLEIRLLANPLYYLQKDLRQIHGVSIEWYEKTLASQYGVCEICGTSDPGGFGNRFSVDHDHSCCPNGKSCEKCRRSLLCMRCNIWIERLESIPGVAKRAIAYLNKYQAIKKPNDITFGLFDNT
jgi:hypothetical protein